MNTSPSPFRQTLRIAGVFIALYAVIFIVNLTLGVIPNLAMRWLNFSPDLRAYLGSTSTYGLRLLAYLLLPALALKVALREKTLPRFFSPLRKDWRQLLFGLALVAAVLGPFFFAMTQLGWLALDGWQWQQLTTPEWLRTLWVGLLVNICVAAGEETLFRGYLLTALKSVWGRGWALLGMMISFGWIHIIAYSESGMEPATLALSLTLAALFGGLFGLIYLRTNSLWLPVTLHFAWNFIENDVLNLTGQNANVNLVGALTRLQEPLTTAQLTLGNVVFIEGLAFALIALSTLLWLSYSVKNAVKKADPPNPSAT
ncbi:MAG: CPBP family intramembrane metalloprotease [Anaerolineaceae bacterium]|nr:CPBP family intramembrane metalloprotease [Anaerolineaceae bacterium]